MKPKQLNFRDGIAKTPFGTYCIDSEHEHKWRFSDGSESHRFGTVEEMQAAAQADFERRARECFEGCEENESLHTDGLTEPDLIGGDN